MIKRMRCLVLFLAIPVLVVPAGDSTIEKGLKGSPLDILARYVREAKFSNFPGHVVNRARYLMLDSIGCALGALQTETGKKYLRLAETWDKGTGSRVIGSGLQVSCMNAAFVNTQLANVLDFDDTYDLYLPAHPGNTLVHTALALGDALGASGQEVLTALVLGYEVSLRAGRAGGAIDWQEPFFTSAMVMGTAAVSSKLLNLSQQEVAAALSHAQEWIVPSRREKFDMPGTLVIPEVKSNFGLDAIKGILAARQAQVRLASWETLLEKGLKDWYLAGGEVKGYHELAADLGTIYRIMEVSFKPTPSCRLTHAAVTALWQALDGKPVKNEDIQEIIILGVKRLERTQWQTMLQAQFSMPCVIALAASGVEPGPRWYTTGRFKDPDILALASKVRQENDPEAEELEIRESRYKCRVKVVFMDGTVKEAVIYDVKGAPGNPMTEEELKNKFRANTRDILSQSRLNRIIDTVMNLEKLKKISLLTDLLRVK